MNNSLSCDDAKQLLGLCQAGRLFDVQQWIHDSRSLTVPEELKKTPLLVALNTGFHSLIELMLRHEVSQHAKNAALAHALKVRRRDLVELTVKYGANIASVTLADALSTWDRGIVSFFLERGADPIADFPFAHAFQDWIRTALGAYLDCRRNRPELASTIATPGRYGSPPLLPRGQFEVGQSAAVGWRRSEVKRPNPRTRR